MITSWTFLLIINYTQEKSKSDGREDSSRCSSPRINADSQSRQTLLGSQWLRLALSCLVFRSEAYGLLSRSSKLSHSLCWDGRARPSVISSPEISWWMRNVSEDLAWWSRPLWLSFLSNFLFLWYRECLFLYDSLQKCKEWSRLKSKLSSEIEPIWDWRQGSHSTHPSLYCSSHSYSAATFKPHRSLRSCKWHHSDVQQGRRTCHEALASCK